MMKMKYKRLLGYRKVLFIKYVIWTRSYLSHLVRQAIVHHFGVSFAGVRIFPGLYLGIMVVSKEQKKSMRRGR